MPYHRPSARGPQHVPVLRVLGWKRGRLTGA